MTSQNSWTHADQEILVAGVEMYGENEWPLIASLLKKSPEECKAKWFTWTEEDQKILKLGKLMPLMVSHWQSITGTIGKSASFCAERYKYLLAKHKKAQGDATENARKRKRVSEDSSPVQKKKHIPPKVPNALKEELQCPVCSEMFVKATTLNCSHTFCKYCIDTWRKSHGSCPYCSSEITSLTSTRVLDNIIKKVIETGSKEVQKSRQELENERLKLDESNISISELGTMNAPGGSGTGNHEASDSETDAESHFESSIESDNETYQW